MVVPTANGTFSIAKRTPRVGAAPHRWRAVGIAWLWLLASQVNVPFVTVLLIESKRSGNRERSPIHHVHPRVRRNHSGDPYRSPHQLCPPQRREGSPARRTQGRRRGDSRRTQGRRR